MTLVIMFGSLTFGYAGFAQSTNSLLEIESSMSLFNVEEIALIESSFNSSDEFLFLGSNQSLLSNSYQQLFIVELEEEIKIEDWMLSPFKESEAEDFNQNHLLDSFDKEEELVLEDWMSNINEWNL